MRLTTRLMLFFLLLSVVPVGVVGWLVYETAKHAIEQGAINHLVSTNLLKEGELDWWLNGNERQLRSLANRPLVSQYAAQLAGADERSPDFAITQQRLVREHLAIAVVDGGFLSLSLIRAADGKILASTEADLLGQYREREPYFIQGKLGTYVDEVVYSVVERQAVLHMSAPVTGPAGDVVAVLAGHANLLQMSEIMNRRTSVIESEDTYLVNKSNFFVTASRFWPDAALKRTLYTAGVEACLRGEDGVAQYADYRGIAVIGAYRWLPERNLCIVAEIDQAEVFAPVLALRHRVLGLSLLIGLVAALLVLSFARTITVPLQRLVRGAEAFARGELDYRVGLQSRDELGQLSRSFDSMAGELDARMAELRVLNDAVESSISAMALSDLEGRLTYVNRAFLKQWGYENEDEVLGQSAVTLWRDPAEAELVVSALEEHGFWMGELSARRRDGTPIDAQLSVNVVTDARGTPICTSAAFADITARKRLEAELRAHRDELEQLVAERTAALRESEMVMRTVIDATNDSIVLLDREGVVLTSNEAFARSLGLEVAELVGQCVYGLLPPALARDRQERVQRVFASGERDRFEDERAGRVLDNSLHPVCDAQGRISGVAAFGRDITARKRAEEALSEKEMLYRTLAESSPDMIFTIDREYRVEYANPAAAQMFGRQPENLIGLSLDNLFPPQSLQRQVESLRTVFETGKAVYLEDAVIFPDVEMWLDTRLVPLADQSGEVSGVMGISRDITARKRSEEDLKRLAADLSRTNADLERMAADLARSNADLEQFAYVSSHDLQEPLRMVSSYVQLLARRYREQLDDDAEEFIAYAVEGANRMQTLISALLAYSRVGKKGRPFERQDSNIILHEALDNLRMAIQDSNATITHDVLPAVTCDGPQLGQVFQNLIANALKFRGDARPVIHVSARRHENEWVFCVKDNGIGIDPQYAERIFVIFQRLHAREEYAGTGIGLAICKRIIERHGGRIWVQSQEGEGSEFYFTIPDFEGGSEHE